MKAPRAVQSIQAKFTEEHKAMELATRQAVGREEYEAAREAFNSRVMADFGDEAKSICKVSYDDLPSFLK